MVLNFADGKQYWHEDGTSVPFGHKSILTQGATGDTCLTMEDIEEALNDDGTMDVDTDAD